MVALARSRDSATSVSPSGAELSGHELQDRRRPLNRLDGARHACHLSRHTLATQRSTMSTWARRLAKSTPSSSRSDFERSALRFYRPLGQPPRVRPSTHARNRPEPGRHRPGNGGAMAVPGGRDPDRRSAWSHQALRARTHRRAAGGVLRHLHPHPVRRRRRGPGGRRRHRRPRQHRLGVGPRRHARHLHRRPDQRRPPQPGGHPRPGRLQGLPVAQGRCRTRWPRPSAPSPPRCSCAGTTPR